jgi:hypothetical protein
MFSSPKSGPLRVVGEKEKREGMHGLGQKFQSPRSLARGAAVPAGGGILRGGAFGAFPDADAPTKT